MSSRGVGIAIHRDLAFLRVPMLPSDALSTLANARTVRDGVQNVLRSHSNAVQALAVSSPALHQALQKPDAQVDDRAWRAAFAYLLRAAGRATPFGLFSAVGAFRLEADEPLTMVGNARARIRPDAEWLAGVARRAPLTEASELCANQLCRWDGSRLYVVQVSNVASESYDIPYRIASIQCNEQLYLLLKDLRVKKTVTLGHLVTKICSEYDCSDIEARKFVSHLLAADVFICPFVPNPVGGTYEEFVGSISLQNGGADVLATSYVDVRANSPEVAVSVASRRQQSMIVNAESRACVQVDAVASLEGGLPSEIVEALSEYAVLRLRASRPAVLGALHQQFIERYEGSTRMVPLLELVDPSRGIDIMRNALPRLWPSNEERARQRKVGQLAYTAIREAALSIALDDLMLEHVLMPLPEPAAISPTFEMGLQIVASSWTALCSGNYLMAPCAFQAGHVAGATSSRFLQMMNDDVASALSEFHKATDSESIVASLNSVPSGIRLLNVQMHPPLTESEIVLGPVRQSRRAIPLEDVLVGFEHGRFTLYSRQFARRIELRQFHVVADRFLDPITRFLYYVSRDGKAIPAGFSWGDELVLPFYPRIQYKQFVLSAATWIYDKSDVPVTPDGFRRWINSQRDLGLPRNILLADSDNHLPIDLESDSSLDVLSHQIQKMQRETLTISESIAAGNAWLQTPHGKVNPEIIVLGRVTATAKDIRRTAQHVVKAIPQRRRALSAVDGWLYAKVYCSEPQQNVCLLRLHESLSALERLNWHFVRYRDNRPHLRFRVQTEPQQIEECFGLAMSTLEKSLASGTIDRYVFDIFEPEVERYGGEAGMKLALTAFTSDSEVAVARIQRSFHMQPSDVFETWRPFGESLCVKKDVCREWLSNNRIYGRKVRNEERDVIRRASNIIRGSARNSVEFLSLLDHVEAILDVRAAADVVSSVFHMHCNRLACYGLDEELAHVMLWRSLQRHLACSTEGHFA